MINFLFGFTVCTTLVLAFMLVKEKRRNNKQSSEYFTLLEQTQSNATKGLELLALAHETALEMQVNRNKVISDISTMVDSFDFSEVDVGINVAEPDPTFVTPISADFEAELFEEELNTNELNQAIEFLRGDTNDTV